MVTISWLKKGKEAGVAAGRGCFEQQENSVLEKQPSSGRLQKCKKNTLRDSKNEGNIAAAEAIETLKSLKCARIHPISRLKKGQCRPASKVQEFTPFRGSKKASAALHQKS